MLILWLCIIWVYKLRNGNVDFTSFTELVLNS